MAPPAVYQQPAVGELAGRAPVPAWLNPWLVRWVQTVLNQLLQAGLNPDGKFGPRTARALAAFQASKRLAPQAGLNAATIRLLQAAPVPGLCGVGVVVSGPVIQVRGGRCVGDAQGPGANQREDVLDLLDRLHILWSISNPDFNGQYPPVAALAPASQAPAASLGRAIAAIRQNRTASLHHLVATNYFGFSVTAPVGAGQRNLPADVTRVQDRLRALGLLDPVAHAAERSVVAAARAAVPVSRIPATVRAIADFKDRIAGGRLGWVPIHADEAEAGGDRFAGRTMELPVSGLCRFPARGGQPAREIVDQFAVSIFVPRGVGATNKVHLFFSPGDVVGSSGFNATLTHGLRAPADSTEWITISVSGIKSGWRTIDRATIAQCLAFVGRPTTLEALRLSGHSRGASSLRETIRRGLVAGAVDRVTVLDASDAFRVLSITAALRAGRTTVSNIVHYGVNLPDLPGATRNLRIHPNCSRAVGYSRIILDAQANRPLLTVPPAVQSQLLPLPPRGCLSPRPASSLTGCRVSIADFCRRNAAAVRTIIRQEVHASVGLKTFIDRNDLIPGFGAVNFPPGIYSHHLFVAEIAHELVD